MTQSALGEALGGLTFQQIQKYEHGLNRIGASRLQQIAIVLGVTIAYFFEGEPMSRAQIGYIRVPETDARQCKDYVETALNLVAGMNAGDRLRFARAYVRKYR
jgi:transcriptional regulator with XRE-family HTH domain